MGNCNLQCLDTGKDFVFPKNYTRSAISVGFGEALLRLLESLTEPLIPTVLNAACGQATSKDQGFEVSRIPFPFRVVFRQRPSRAEGRARNAHHSIARLLLILIIGARQVLDRFPHASVNVRGAFSIFFYLILLGRA